MAHAVLTDTATSPHKRTGVVILGLLIVFLVLLNIVYFVFLRQTGNTISTSQAIPGGGVIQAIAVDDHTVVALTSGNRLILLKDGQIASDKQLTGTITVLAIPAATGKIYGGTSDREVIIWDDQLNEQSRFKVNGRVVGLAVDDEGKLVIGFGIGKYSGKFWVGRFDEAGQADYTKSIGIDVATVETKGNTGYYSTVDGKLGALDSGGNKLWQVTTKHPVLLMDMTQDGRIVGADERGGVSLIDPDKGQVIWRQQLSDYTMRMVAYDPVADKIAAGDDDGKIFMLNMNGQPFYQTSASASPIRSFIHSAQGDIVILTGNGEWIKVNLDLALGSQRQQTVNTAWLLGNLALLLGAAATVITLTPRLRVPTLRMLHEIKNSRTAYLLILPSMLMIAVFAYIPTIMGLYYAFTNFNLSEPIRFIGFQNFVKIANDSFFWTGVGNMLLILVTSLLKAFTIPLLIAELIFWLRWTRAKYWMRVAFIIPSIVPGVVGILLWKQIYDPQIGLINELLKVAGLGSLARGWLSDATTAIWAIIFAGFPWVDIFAFLIYFGGLLNINPEIFDAAAIDGAGAWKRFINLDLQMIRPQLRLILFFTFLGSVQGYGGIWIMTRGGPGTATYVPGLQMFLQIAAAEFGYASAIGLVLALVILMVTVWRFRFNDTPEAA